MTIGVLRFFSFVSPLGAHQEEVSLLERTRINEIFEKAQLTKSSSFLLIKNRETLVSLSVEGKPIETHSITKSIISLGIGILLDQGKITSIDQSISDWYPEWKGSPKEKITLRHILTHTSGLQAASSGQEIYENDDCIAFALSADLTSVPGTKFFYNNKAVNLLSGIIEKVSGKRADIWIQEKLFNPLGITGVMWSSDLKGHIHAHAGLKVQATDLAKIGQIVLDHGIWKGERLISQKWLEKSMELQTPALSDCGLLWWIYDGPLYAAEGYRGQYLIVIPRLNIVVVRQTEATDDLMHWELPKDLLRMYGLTQQP